MQRRQNKIVRFLLNAPPRFHVGANEFKTVGLLHVECRVEQLKLGHMCNIINLTAPSYLRTNVEMVHHRYPTRASNLACVILNSPVMITVKSFFKMSFNAIKYYVFL